MNYERVISIGDIHGELFLLRQLIKKINPSKNDLLVFLGDYIDRGKYSKEVIDYLIELGKNFNCIFLLGNHEEFLLLSKDDEEVAESWILNGGTATLESYNVTDYNNWFSFIPKEHIDFYNNLRLSYQTDRFFFSHAGVNRFYPLDLQRRDDLLWNRNSIGQGFDKVIVHGHTPVKKGPVVTEYEINVDTGGFYYGRLTGYDVLNNVIYQYNKYKPNS